MGEEADEFDLSQRPALLDIPDTEIIDVNPDTLAFLGGVIVPYISQNLTVSRDQAVASPDRSAWERDAGVGLGPSGPYADWENLYDAFIDVSVGTTRTPGRRRAEAHRRGPALRPGRRDRRAAGRPSSTASWTSRSSATGGA